MPQRPLRGLRPRADLELVVVAVLCLSARCADCVFVFYPFDGYDSDLCLSARCADCVHAGGGQTCRHVALCLSARCADCVHADLGGDHEGGPLCLSARCADCVGKTAQIMTQYVIHNAVSR